MPSGSDVITHLWLRLYAGTRRSTVHIYPAFKLTVLLYEVFMVTKCSEIFVDDKPCQNDSSVSHFLDCFCVCHLGLMLEIVSRMLGHQTLFSHGW